MGSSNRKRTRTKRKLHDGPSAGEGSATVDVVIPGSPVASKRKRLSSLSSQSSLPKQSASSECSFLEKMRARLSGGHFRMLNEKLYTTSGNEAFDLFKKEPTLFDVYHAGYQEQMSHWPEQPVKIIIRWLKDHSPSLVVADFGCGEYARNKWEDKRFCGDARIAKTVRNKVFSIDLVSNDPCVLACDMSKTPLVSSSVDVAVFCLSLMGTNFPSYLVEASRVLKPGGWLLIAEVKSRFDPNSGSPDPDLFIKCVHKLGFSTVSKDFSNKMFILLFFRKTETSSSKRDIPWPKLKPCLYKRR